MTQKNVFDTVKQIFKKKYKKLFIDKKPKSRVWYLNSSV